MRKSAVNSILAKDIKRRNKIISFVCLIILLFIISLSLVLVYIQKSKFQYVKYSESSDVDYNVYLKENEFYEEDYIGKNNQYIASLIDKIETKFNYNLSFDRDDVEHKYTYRIEAEVNVSDSETKNNVYKKTYTLLNKKEVTSTNKDITINEKLDIDYKEYNELITKFINVYGIDTVNSVLKVSMYIDVTGDCDSYENGTTDETVLTLEIPLTEKTIAIDINNNLVDGNGNDIMLCKKSSNVIILLLISAVIIFLIGVYTLIYLINYITRTRSAKNSYQRELKKILSNYSSYIEQITGEFNFHGYQLVKVSTFEDMIEIRDTILQPILMLKNKEINGTYFIIPSNTKMLYVYKLKISDFKK